MKKILILFLIFFSTVVQASVDEDLCPTLNLGIQKSEATPVVKVAPEYPKSTGRYLPACVIVSFELKEKPGTEGKVLIPSNIKIESATIEVWKEPVKVAVSKWIYLSKNVEYRGRQYVDYRLYLANP